MSGDEFLRTDAPPERAARKTGSFLPRLQLCLLRQSHFVV